MGVLGCGLPPGDLARLTLRLKHFAKPRDQLEVTFELEFAGHRRRTRRLLTGRDAREGRRRHSQGSAGLGVGSRLGMQTTVGDAYHPAACRRSSIEMVLECAVQTVRM